MCDYSLAKVKSRAAKIEDKLVTKNFGTGTTGFCAEGEEDCAICLLPGTEIVFKESITLGWASLVKKLWVGETRTAIFRQINKDEPYAHHDALEFPNGDIKLLTMLDIGQKAKVLQLPAAPKTEQEAKDQTRLQTVG